MSLLFVWFSAAVIHQVDASSWSNRLVYVLEALFGNCPPDAHFDEWAWEFTEKHSLLQVQIHDWDGYNDHGSLPNTLLKGYLAKISKLCQIVLLALRKFIWELYIFYVLFFIVRFICPSVGCPFIKHNDLTTKNLIRSKRECTVMKFWCQVGTLYGHEFWRMYVLEKGWD